LNPLLNRSIPPLNPAAPDTSFVGLDAGPWPAVVVPPPAAALVTVDAEEAGVTDLDGPELGVVVTLCPLDTLVEPDPWLALGGFDSFGGHTEFVVNKLPSDGLTA
jgi:hypothetical protein